MLRLAAELLPDMTVDGVRVAYHDVGAALFEAARCRGCGGVHECRVVADDTAELLAWYLLVAGVVVWRPWTSRMLRPWVAGRSLAELRADLVAAADYWRGVCGCGASAGGGRGREVPR